MRAKRLKTLRQAQLGVGHQSDGKAQLFELRRNRFGIVDGVTERRAGIVGIADHERKPRRLLCILRNSFRSLSNLSQSRRGGSKQANASVIIKPTTMKEPRKYPFTESARYFPPPSPASANGAQKMGWAVLGSSSRAIWAFCRALALPSVGSLAKFSKLKVVNRTVAFDSTGQ